MKASKQKYYACVKLIISVKIALAENGTNVFFDLVFGVDSLNLYLDKHCNNPAFYLKLNLTVLTCRDQGHVDFSTNQTWREKSKFIVRLAFISQ